MPSLKDILMMDEPTGKELGIVGLAFLASDYNSHAADDIDYDTYNDRMEILLESGSQTDRDDYYGYAAIERWLRVKHGLAEAHFQQAQLQFRTLSTYLTQAFLAEQCEANLLRTPVIMTQSQYDRAIEEGREEYLANKGSDVFDLIERWITFNVEEMKKHPRRKNPLKEIREKYRQQPVGGKIIPANYNRATHNGYYITSDGHRSDKMTPSKWERTKASLQLKGEKPVFKLYENLPDGLCKWDIIENELLLNFYPYKTNPDGTRDYDDEAGYIETVQDFISEFGELADLAIQTVQREYLDGSGIDIRTIPITSWNLAVAKWHSLYDADYCGMRAEADDETRIFSDSKRAVFAGVAILQERDGNRSSVKLAENGDYPEDHQVINSLISAFGAESFFPEAINYKTNSFIIRNAYATMLRSSRYVNGYNTALEIIAEKFEAPALRDIKLNISPIITQMNKINGMTLALLDTVRQLSVYDSEKADRKIEAIHSLFKAICIREANVPKRNIKKAIAMMDGYQAFTGDNAIIFAQLLCGSDEEYGIPVDMNGG